RQAVTDESLQAAELRALIGRPGATGGQWKPVAYDEAIRLEFADSPAYGLVSLEDNGKVRPQYWPDESDTAGHQDAAFDPVSAAVDWMDQRAVKPRPKAERPVRASKTSAAEVAAVLHGMRGDPSTTD